MTGGAQGFLLVALGSAVGGMGRYGVSLAAQRWEWLGLPWGTLLVNVVGGALIGLVAAADHRLLQGHAAEQLLVIGVLGGFTTFSAFSLQTLKLVHTGQPWTALAYAGGSVILCVGAAAVAYELGST